MKILDSQGDDEKDLPREMFSETPLSLGHLWKVLAALSFVQVGLHLSSVPSMQNQNDKNQTTDYIQGQVFFSSDADASAGAAAGAAATPAASAAAIVAPTVQG